MRGFFSTEMRRACAPDAMHRGGQSAALDPRPFRLSAIGYRLSAIGFAALPRHARQHRCGAKPRASLPPAFQAPERLHSRRCQGNVRITAAM
ncbi:hypothetical protein EYR26_17625 [Xanthomonas oryzae]|nr:hypothetical protein EYR26_17625 [Xanthomonas oryzae]